jgi:hypothetical protein
LLSMMNFGGFRSEGRAATHLGHAEHNPSGNDRFCVLGPLIVSLSFKAEEEGGKQRTAMQYTPGTMGRLFSVFLEPVCTKAGPSASASQNEKPSVTSALSRAITSLDQPRAPDSLSLCWCAGI